METILINGCVTLRKWHCVGIHGSIPSRSLPKRTGITQSV